MKLSHIVNKENSPVPVKVIEGSSGVTGVDVENGESLSGVSYEKDENGYPVIRVVDAAPFAYDPHYDATKVTVQGARKILKINLSESDNVVAGGSKTVTVSPPTGKIWTVHALFTRYANPSDATSGTHRLDLRYGWNYDRFEVLTGITAHNKSIVYSYGIFSSDVDTQIPSNELLQRDVIRDMHLTEKAPLYA